MDVSVSVSEPVSIFELLLFNVTIHIIDAIICIIKLKCIYIYIEREIHFANGMKSFVPRILVFAGSR